MPVPWAMEGREGRDHLSATERRGAFAFDLSLTTDRPPVLHGGVGWIDFGPAGGSYYYSRTRMLIEGSLALDGGDPVAVTGIAWFDHQWGDFIAVGAGGWGLGDGRWRSHRHTVIPSAQRPTPNARYNPPMSHAEHHATSPSTVRCAVLAISDTRTRDTDTSGAAIAELLSAAGHTVHERLQLPDDPEAVRLQVEAWIAFPGVDVVITTGGTGLTARDSTHEALAGLIEKRLDGFGELFRMLSYHEIGPAAMLTRAFAGAVRGTIIIALPGAEAAVRLAMTKLVVPELGHLVREARR